MNEKGVFIPPSQLFENVRKNALPDENLNETLEKVFRGIEESAAGTASEGDFKGLFDDMDVNSNKLGGSFDERKKRLVRLLNCIGDMGLGSYKDNTIDAFLSFRKYKILSGKGSVSRESAEAKAKSEYEIFKRTQKYVSDFDRSAKGLGQGEDRHERRSCCSAF